jgi:hypothetical protein
MVRPPAWVPEPIVEDARAISEERFAVPLKVGLAEKTAFPVPVSSPRRPARSAEVWSEEDASFACQTEAEKICASASVPPTRLAPIVVVATTLPEESVPRSAEVSAVRYVFPVFVSIVVEACASCVKPVNVEEACERRPLWSVWRAVQVLAEERSWEFETRHVPFTAKQPEARFTPVP